MVQNKIQALVIGLGGIGLEYDYHSNSKVLTHSKALFLNKNYNLLCGVDINNKAKKRFIEKYKIPVESSVTKALIKYSANFVVISASTTSHFKIFKEVSEFSFVKFVLLEKPGGVNYKEFNKILKIAKKKKILIFVNYFRMYNSYFTNIVEKLKKYRKFDIFVVYNRGLTNICGHYISFLNLFLKNIKKIKIISKGDNFKNEIQPSFQLIYENAKVTFLSSNIKFSSYGEIQINTEKCQLLSMKNFNEFTINYRQQDKDLKKNYFNYSYISKKIINNSNKNFSQKIVYDKIYKIIRNKKKYQKILYKNYLDTFFILYNIKKLT